MENWRFFKGSFENIEQIGDIDNNPEWEHINLPHTWNMVDGEDGGSDYYRGDGWYYKKFNVPDSFLNKQVFIEFLGANSVSDVYINGTWLGQHKGGYTAFRYDITKYIYFNKENVLLVKVSNKHDPTVIPQSGDFTFFGGIYRDVTLIACEKVHVDLLDYGSSGLYIIPEKVTRELAYVTVCSTIHNDSDIDKQIDIQIKLKEPDAFTTNAYEDRYFSGLPLRFNKEHMGNGTVVIDDKVSVSIKAGETYHYKKSFTVQRPHLWDGLNDPFRYETVLNRYEGNQKLDDVMQYVGFRY